MPSETRVSTRLSVVVPMYDEQDVLPLFAARLRPVLDGCQQLRSPAGDLSYEVIAVDDGSRDTTAALLTELAASWPQLRIVRLRRNAGHQGALTAGLDRCGGDWVVTIDVDLQDPPELIPALFAAAAADDVDVVYAVRDDRSADTVFKRLTAGLYYRAMRRAAGDGVPGDAGDFRLMSAAVVEDLRALPEKHRVYRLLVPWLGYPSSSVRYRRDPRAAGSTKYPVSRMARLAVDSVTSFTARPLRIATWIGVLGSLLCVIAMATAVGAYVLGATVPGWASVFVAVLFVGAVQLLCLGLLGEYVGRLYAEAQHRPLYFVASDTGAGRSATGGAAGERTAHVGYGSGTGRR